MHSNAPIPNRLLEALRAGTRQAHERLEQATGLLDPELDPMHYVQVLARLLDVTEPLEAAVAAQVPPHLQAFWAERRKAHLLDDDLAYWAQAGVAAAAPRAVKLPALDNLAHAFGTMYVLEGATLGGAVIAPHVERRLGLAPGAGTRYFRAYGGAASRMWRDFRFALAREVDASQAVAVVAAASDTFEAFSAALGCPQRR